MNEYYSIKSRAAPKIVLNMKDNRAAFICQQVQQLLQIQSIKLGRPKYKDSSVSVAAEIYLYSYYWLFEALDSVFVVRLIL